MLIKEGFKKNAHVRYDNGKIASLLMLSQPFLTLLTLFTFHSTYLGLRCRGIPKNLKTSFQYSFDTGALKYAVYDGFFNYIPAK